MNWTYFFEGFILTFSFEYDCLCIDSTLQKVRGLYKEKDPQVSRIKTHCLGLYIIKNISNGGAVKLAKLNGQLIPGQVNGSRLKAYRDDSVPRSSH